MTMGAMSSTGPSRTTAVDRILTRTAIDGGGTFGTNGHAIRHAGGYMVGGAGSPARILPMVKVRDRSIGAHAAVESVMGEVDAIGGRTYVGTWVDGDMAYIEASSWVADLAQADALGRNRGERAIYDVTNGTTLWLV